MMTNELDALEQFLGSYFHQDWMLESSDPNEIVRLFLRENPRSEIELVCADINVLLAKQPQESELEAVFRNFGCYFDPALAGLSRADWLRSVRQMLSGPL